MSEDTIVDTSSPYEFRSRRQPSYKSLHKNICFRRVNAMICHQDNTSKSKHADVNKTVTRKNNRQPRYVSIKQGGRILLSRLEFQDSWKQKSQFILWYSTAQVRPAHFKSNLHYCSSNHETNRTHTLWPVHKMKIYEEGCTTCWTCHPRTEYLIICYIWCTQSSETPC